ncbi:trehalose-phosphate phosphatase-like [Neocloeon triangulifer]|uniref:trehalose-phosphate phosphatase-like n=1 Tax=Neocloeon triangulifer TaxID=2078957 RepID=UPI00286F8E74|nr:trehalose-phosphate phosphatase-like [Neocloeon triangulifer]
MNPAHAAVQAVAGRKQVAILLDYDGTLAPIAPHPDLAVLPEATVAVLRKLSARALVAIISGRSLTNVRQMVGIDGLAYAGGHGLHIMHRDGSTYDHPLPKGSAETIKTLIQELQTLCRDGAWIEDKGGQLTFHYREVPSELHDYFAMEARSIIQNSGLKVGLAHCAVEARPIVQWHKGAACLKILEQEFGSNWPQECSVIYAGDDTTDEDAFKSLQGSGFTIRVTTSGDVETAAQVRVPSTESLLNVLEAVADQLEAQ